MRNFCYALSVVLILSTSRSYGSEAGMPQLNPEFWAAQVFWLILIFSILYIVIWKIFLPKITYSIENRKSKIVDDVHEAQKLKENVEKKILEYDQITHPLQPCLHQIQTDMSIQSLFLFLIFHAMV